jgi:hypothetical protein
MRKILILLSFVLLSLVSFSQENLFGRAYLLYTAESDGTELVWNNEPIKCDILVQIEGQKVTIYSKETQIYRIVSLEENDVNTSKYKAVNTNGVKCYLYIGRYGEFDDIAITIEFSDLGWTYVVSEDY